MLLLLCCLEAAARYKVWPCLIKRGISRPLSQRYLYLAFLMAPSAEASLASPPPWGDWVSKKEAPYLVQLESYRHQHPESSLTKFLNRINFSNTTAENVRACIVRPFVSATRRQDSPDN
jgi:hypothetical protein